MDINLFSGYFIYYNYSNNVVAADQITEYAFLPDKSPFNLSSSEKNYNNLLNQ